MSPEERELLNKSVSLSEENNKILHSMKRSMRIASITRAVYWIFIIGSAIGAFYLLQPYVDQLKSIYAGASETLNNLKLGD
ncbi:hypothetical protein A2738_00855 [Candidatus Nomurabacteria bacterium RIFCSPHIGHO2_01_FULL_42_15]|uniref:Uncharacterized protein n=1 Tax=Candidatus Nomurabacteria bacterium RIFCSPHIGHO2_01_FULL_42_15 TaxID=1801742 RepID=A0A1F6VFL5_9BACT|nr:MAG: hypothetical protein A2738_00855 [Candidatus Nomurabacteria bacterium RIFCSPHIGHO2_01_FULL_42_15]OGI93155.1 MAG: hypothetical protein A3A99_01315 [Candidatus Nomurabacteria bacterium RIFCSPLOWO2_01_FULL_41_18]